MILSTNVVIYDNIIGKECKYIIVLGVLLWMLSGERTKEKYIL